MLLQANPRSSPYARFALHFGPSCGLLRIELIRFLIMAEEATQNPTAVAKPKPKRKSKSAKKPRKVPPYNVILLDDDEHTYEYVIEMLGSLFRYERPKAFQLARLVDQTGRAILLTTTKEHAELKRDQIHAFGPDKRIGRCKGSMSARIEPIGK